MPNILFKILEFPLFFILFLYTLLAKSKGDESDYEELKKISLRSNGVARKIFFDNVNWENKYDVQPTIQDFYRVC